MYMHKQASRASAHAMTRATNAFLPYAENENKEHSGGYARIYPVYFNDQPLVTAKVY